ncbi:stage III sporulation protein AB [uncultured Intestinimonas sp.]|uniref:stage III sporulation protein AB n=1 Tax=uncultured Intestinimonas sp. TaxID=1689265 RepID=UPI0025E2A87C|nr:stage III sporulation protein AB [uncultured Intestinimonas sp.]
MLKWLGAAFLLGGGLFLGLGAAEQLHARVRCLRALLGAVEWAERELSFRLTPLPALLEGLESRSLPPVSALFSGCGQRLDELGEKPFGTLWREAADAAGLPLDEAAEQTVYSLGDILGRFDAEGQRGALEERAAELREHLRRAEEDRDRLCRVYTALGAGTGALLTILLI